MEWRKKSRKEQKLVVDVSVERQQKFLELILKISKAQNPQKYGVLTFITLEKSKGGFENILVITDYFTKYAMAVPTKNQLAKTTA